MHARLRMGHEMLMGSDSLPDHYKPMQVFSVTLSTEYERAWYGRLVGAYFASHPHIQRATVRIEDRGHASTEDLPNPENRVMVDRNGGVRLHYRPNNVEAHQILTRKLRHLLDHLGCEPQLLPQNAYFGKRLPIAGTGHQNGTVRFGHDPKASALDINCRAHEVNNLYVVDGSVMPSQGSANPALTIMALAAYAADRMARR